MFIHGFSLTAMAITSLASPSTTTKDQHPSQVRRGPDTATHSVVVGRAGFRFNPENIVANIGDIIEFHFTPRGHSVAQSSFANPCVPSGPDAFFSGFIPVSQDQEQSRNVFQVEIKDKSPIWFYCSQNNNQHCANGMSGVINQGINASNTLAAYKIKAQRIRDAVSPARIGGGSIVPNPNLLSSL